jgi:hemoglobin-like flavoprotein
MRVPGSIMLAKETEHARRQGNPQAEEVCRLFDSANASEQTNASAMATALAVEAARYKTMVELLHILGQVANDGRCP